MNPDELRKNIDTVVIVMLENRSFDHLFGHKSLPEYGGSTAIRGIRSLSDAQYVNPSGDGIGLSPYISADSPLPNDLPHERDRVAQQLAKASLTGKFTMNGFVQAYEQFTGTTGVLRPPPLGLLTPRDLPMSCFLADEYALCDQWFAPLPASTQPNRLMALSGYTLIDTTHSGLVPSQHTLFDWLSQRDVRWRIYSAGLPFFLLMPSLWGPLLSSEHQRGLNALAFDIQYEPDSSWPQVLWIEPDYNDSPVHLGSHANDNHPPLPMAFGEAFLRQVYQLLTSNPKRFGRAVMVVTYDEHGGFYDHFSPAAVPSPVPAGAQYTRPFDSTGVRVPAMVVSPFVERGVPHGALLDHTSTLQLLAQRFGRNGEGYSPEVEARRLAGIQSVADVLTAGIGRATIPQAPAAPIAGTAMLRTTSAPVTDHQSAFVAAMEGIAAAHGEAALQKFPEIAHWQSQ